MRQPADYLPPADASAPPGYILAKAEQALVRQAADAARYRTLLLRALFNYKALKP